MFEDGADLLSRLAEAFEGELRRHALESLVLQLGDWLALRKSCRHRLAVKLSQLRLVVEGFEMRWSARHVEEDDLLRFGGKMQWLEERRPVLIRRGGTEASGAEQRGQRCSSEHIGLMTQKSPAAEFHLIGRVVVHNVLGSVASDGFVEIQDGAGHRHPGRQLDSGKLPGSRVLADSDQLAGGFLVFP